jgi:hypothetical protein
MFPLSYADDSINHLSVDFVPIAFNVQGSAKLKVRKENNLVTVK